MRNGQKRMRGRGNNNHRKSQNPLTRVYESNGPDVKIRGTAHHIAEKYLQLARDAQGSGDPVTAENYFQHAEHYFRLIAAAQEQFRAQNPYYQAPPAPGATADDAFEGDDEDAQPGQGQPQNAGVLKVNNDLKGSFSGTTPAKVFDVKVTADDSPSVSQPSGPEIFHGSVQAQ